MLLFRGSRHVYLFCSEALSVTLKKEHRLRVYENRVLKGIFGPKREEVAGDWVRQHNEKLSNLYISPEIISMIKSRGMRWVGHGR
jgi:hypothetical protein